MPDYALTLNGLPADLSTNLKNVIRLTQATNTLTDLTTRTGEYSWPLTLPNTRANAAIFGPLRLHELGQSRFGLGTNFAFELRCAGEVFTGTFELTALKEGYTGRLFMDGFSWALLMGEKTLPELQLPGIPYDGSQVEAIQLLTADSSDIQFPLISYGNFFHPPTLAAVGDGTTEERSLPPSALLTYPLAVDDMIPSVWLVNVLRRIFQDIGWHVQGRILDSAEWRNVLITPAGANLENAWNWGTLLLSSGTSSGTSQQYQYWDRDDNLTTATGIDADADAGDLDGHAMAGDIFFLPLPVVGSGPTRALDGARSSYTAAQSGVYDFTYSATIGTNTQSFFFDDFTFVDDGTGEVVAAIYPVALAVVVLRGGSYDGAAADLLSTGTATPDEVPAYHLLDMDAPTGGTHNGTASVYLEVGDVVQLCIFAHRRLVDTPSNTVAVTRRQLVINITSAAFACTHYANNDGISETLLYPARFLPALSQRELVKWFLVQTNSVLLPDPARKIATILSREELSAAAGPPLDITARCDPKGIEYTPVFGAGVGAVVFSPAEADDDPLAPADVVSYTVGLGTGKQEVSSPFSSVGFRTYRVRQNNIPVFSRKKSVSLPTIATADGLKTPLAEVEHDLSGLAPRLLRWEGADPTLKFPFQSRLVPIGRASWGGALAWAGDSGAVSVYYTNTLRQGLIGDTAKVGVSLTPTLYRQLVPGRLVTIAGAVCAVQAVPNFDPTSPATLTQVELVRQVV